MTRWHMFSHASFRQHLSTSSLDWLAGRHVPIVIDLSDNLGFYKYHETQIKTAL